MCRDGRPVRRDLLKNDIIIVILCLPIPDTFMICYEGKLLRVFDLIVFQSIGVGDVLSAIVC